MKHIDGTSGLESLEELYASKNSIRDISSCSNLPNIKVIDVRRYLFANNVHNSYNLFLSYRNCVVDITALTFLSLCPVLEHIWLDENEEIINFPKYRQTVKNLIPCLKTLDGLPFTEGNAPNMVVYKILLIFHNKHGTRKYNLKTFF